MGHSSRMRTEKGAPNTGIHKTVVLLSYIYLALPMVIFLLGWCRLVVGVPLAGVVIWSLYLCFHNRENYIELDWKLSQADKWKIVTVIAIIFAWVVLSGVGGYVWQNFDHISRNATFNVLINQNWPPTLGDRGLTYYMGTWLPAALIGKIASTEAGYTALFIWILLGICLLYSLICIWRRKIVLWPLVILIFFSGLDLIGNYIFLDREIHLFGSEHLECYLDMLQYSSNTTQLYWVFNQAIPAWLGSMLLFMDEPPKNMIWIWGLLAITSTLPLIGLLPIMIYYLFRRSQWEPVLSVGHGWRMLWDNIASIQNLAGGGAVLIISFLYLMGNDTFTVISATVSVENGAQPSSLSVWFPIILLLVMMAAMALTGCLVIWLFKQGKEHILKNMLYITAVFVVALFIFQKLGTARVGGNAVYRLACTVLFLVLEVGFYLFLVYRDVEDKGLFNVVVVSLLVIPFIRLGYSNDFCMRVSIPALFILMLWCIGALGKKRMNIRIIMLLVCLLIGSATPIHEIKRTLINSRTEFTLESCEEETVFGIANFGGSRDTFFWKYIARKRKA